MGDMMVVVYTDAYMICMCFEAENWVERDNTQ